MTPAERARQIDQQEFAAECKAARDRAFAYVKQCRKLEKDSVGSWIAEERTVVNKVNQLQISDRAHRHTVNGQTRTLIEWASIVGITPQALLHRRRKLGSMAAAIAFQPTGRWAKPAPGVVSNLPTSKGTGAGSTAQESPEITFSEMDENA
ncbi:hypothetical protein GFB56_00265 [Ensifer sp. T173]|uniref:Uncharacterized protein n=1 Tax=Ensifer canadensis TaxID=555315 RepID=A0AAW4FAV3_9HYPH|nr:hypothetical protein [Ensifer canadensis]MBM3089253.1 hypothetical protein [Ensifer canadensis]UBI76823.1 hypothetical protein J3R84_06760 [Ensifer canadensis]